MLDDVPILFLAYYAYTYSLDTVTYALQYVFLYCSAHTVHLNFA